MKRVDTANPTTLAIVQNHFLLNRDGLSKLLLQRQGFEWGMSRRVFDRAVTSTPPMT